MSKKTKEDWIEILGVLAPIVFLLAVFLIVVLSGCKRSDLEVAPRDLTSIEYKMEF